jgi:acetylglutamate kinase
MEEAIRKATVLIEALPYLRAYRGKLIAIKLGGAAMTEPSMLDVFLQDVVFLQMAGVLPVIVHGGGPNITEEMSRRGLTATFVKGRRVTDPQTLAIVREVLVGINEELVGGIRTHGGRAEGLHVDGQNALVGRRLQMTDEAGEPIDLGLVGEVTQVRTVLIEGLARAGIVPVIAPLAEEVAAGGVGPGTSRAGARRAGPAPSILNINADTAAGRVAAALIPEKLVVVSDTHGVRIDPEDAESFASTLTREQIENLVARGVIDRGMLPKVQACLEALEAGVPKAHIIDGRIPHSLLLEIFTDRGIGTQILH